MSRATPKLRELAQRLIAFETRENSSENNASDVALVLEKLRPHLATLMGSAGYRALLSRALALTHTEVHWLRPVQVRADGTLVGLDELGKAGKVGAEEIAEGRELLVAQLLGLLETFIGENLMVRLVGEAWPKLTLNDFDSGGTSEKA